MPDMGGELDSVAENAATVGAIASLVSSLKHDLNGLLPEVAPSLRSIVEQVRPELRAARARGVSWQQLAKHFAAKGLEINPETLRVYVSTATPTRAARGLRRIQQTSASRAPRSSSAATDTTDASKEAFAAGVVVAASTARSGARLAPRVK